MKTLDELHDELNDILANIQIAPGFLLDVNMNRAQEIIEQIKEREKDEGK